MGARCRGDGRPRGAGMTLLNWTADKVRDFGKKNLLFTHHLADSELFTEEGLIALIDRYPRDRLEINTRGYDPTAFGQWYKGRVANLDGRKLMEAVRAGRLWMNLRRVN